MTDNETLITYRLSQAHEALAAAKATIDGAISFRAAVNRSYYAMFYSLNALMIKADLQFQTSKHTGIIAAFDKEFVKTKKFEPKYSEMLHAQFQMRQQGDYKELVEISEQQANVALEQATQFVQAVEEYVSKLEQH